MHIFTAVSSPNNFACYLDSCLLIQLRFRAVVNQNRKPCYG